MYIFKVGNGIDIHPFATKNSPNATKKLYLGGIEIPYSHYLVGHSDADVVLHALTDALLGALGLGDIGDFFPPSDNKWQGCSSKVFVEFACEKLKEANGTICNIDINILAEEPKISPYKQPMKAKIAEICGINTANINIKATTFEKLGTIGRKEGIIATAVTCIKLPD